MVTPQEFLIPIKQQKVYSRIVDQFVDLLDRGEFTPGMRLPSERELAKHLSVSRASLREALTVMQMMGLVKTVSGGGTFISEKPRPERSYPIPQYIGESPFEILQARKTIEPAIAALASIERKESSLQKLAEIVENVKADLTKTHMMGEIYAEGDREFHLEIAVATGNPVLVVTQQIIHNLMGQQLWQVLVRNTHISIPGRFEAGISEHVGILDAIRLGKSQLAHNRVKAHLARVERIMQHAELLSATMENQANGKPLIELSGK